MGGGFSDILTCPPHPAFGRRSWYNWVSIMSDLSEATLKQKKLLREALAGYAAANEVIEQERIERLRHITDEESRADYAMLLSFDRLFKNEADREGLERIKQWRLQEKVAMRQVFERVARARGLI